MQRCLTDAVTAMRNLRYGSANARVKSNAVADKKRQGRLGNFVQRPCPRVQVNQLLLMEGAKMIVKLSNGRIPLDMSKQLGQRAIAGRAGFAPLTQMIEDRLVQSRVNRRL